MEKLIEILNKTEKTEEEISYVENLIKTNNDAKELYGLYYNLENAVKNLVHLSSEDIANFILLKNGISTRTSFNNKLIKTIQEHLDSCKNCKEELELLSEEYLHLSSHISEAITLKHTVEQKTFNILPSIFLKQNSFVKYSFAFTVFLVFVYFSAFIISDFITPNYFNSASIKSEREFYVTRSRGTDDFQKSLSAFDNDNFNKGIKYLERDIKDNSNDKTIFYSYYILGIAYLQSAENSYLKLFKYYDDDMVKKGINNLVVSIQKNNSGNFDNVNYNAYYYLAKGYLMLENIEKAKTLLKKVIDKKGSKMADAQQLIKGLE